MQALRAALSYVHEQQPVLARLPEAFGAGVWDFCFRVSGLGFRVQGLAPWVSGPKVSQRPPSASEHRHSGPQSLRTPLSETPEPHTPKLEV